MIALHVSETQAVSDTLKRFVLRRADGGALPAAQPGAHMPFVLAAPGRARRNAYSLAVIAPDRYEIIVRRVPGSRGGSEFLHAAVEAGHGLSGGVPQNLFPPDVRARRHLLLAGGIGLTPFLAYLAALGDAAELHQFCREEDAGTFAGLLAPYAGRACVHAGMSALERLPALLAREGLGTHVYTCGPEPFMVRVRETARRLGWPVSRIHSESFGAAVATGGVPFRAVLARSGITVPVPEDASLLEAMEDAGVDAPYLCRGGACGQCRVGVISGVPDHRDHVLNDAERARGDAILTCVSRARTAELVLDI